MKRLTEQKAGVLLSYLNMILGTVVPIFYTPIMLDLLGTSEYGLYSLSQSVTSYLSLLNLGLGTAIGRYLSKYRLEGDLDATRRLLGLFITLYSCASVLVCVIGAGMTLFADNFFAQGLAQSEIARLRVLVLIMTLSVATALPISTFASVITAYERFVFSRLIAILGTILTPLINLVLLYLGRGSVGMAVFGLVFQLGTGFVYALYCAKRLKITPSFRRMPFDLLKELAGFCAFVVLGTLVDMLYWSTDKVLVGAVLGSVAVAVYNIGGVFTSILQNMAHAVSDVFIPRVMMMASEKKQQSMKEISSLMIRVGRLQFYIVSFVLSGYIVFGQRFIKLWAGADYGEAYYVALLTMLPLVVPLIQSVAFSTIMAQNKHRFRSIVYAIIAVVNVITTYLVLPYYGIIGAAACTAIAFVLGNGIIMNIYYYRVVKLDIPGFWKNILRIGVMPLVLTVVSWFVMNRLVSSDAPWLFLIGVAMYSLIFWVLNWVTGMNPYEKELVLGFLKKRSNKW